MSEVTNLQTVIISSLNSSHEKIQTFERAPSDNLKALGPTGIPYRAV